MEVNGTFSLCVMLAFKECGEWNRYIQLDLGLQSSLFQSNFLYQYRRGTQLGEELFSYADDEADTYTAKQVQ